MERSSLEFLEELLNSMSPSGFEEEAAKVWKERAKGFADRVFTDYHGNNFAVLNESGNPKVMLAGHIDEIGFMVKYIDDDGFLFFEPIGGHDLQITQGQRVWIRTRRGKILGLIGKKPIHLMDEAERKKVPKIEELWIDIGVKNREEAQALVEIGDPAVVAYEFSILRGDTIAARGVDDRVGAFVVLEALRLLAQGEKPSAAVYAVSTVQEEVGLRGARTSAFRINPQVGIAVDVTFAMDHPWLEREKKVVGEIKIGKGPVIARGPNMSPKVVDLIIETAKEKEIPHQFEGIPRGTGTDANVIQLTRSGVATGLVSIPNRYMHTPCEIVSLTDLDNAVKLIAETVRKLSESTLLEPY